MNKKFISYDLLRNNALKLAARIYKEGFIPDVIYLPLRGGAYMGNVVSEFFKLALKDRKTVFYAAVVARSYSNIRQQHEIMIDGWTYNPEYLRNGDKILFVDDIFDSGRTINYLVDVIMQRGIPREDIKVAVHDYKVFNYREEALPVQPDYWCNRHLIKDPSRDLWIHYLSHELVGLTEDEIKEFYLENDPQLTEAFQLMHKI